jgi:hypothetical protein
MQILQRLTERIYSGFEVRDHARMHVGDNFNYYQGKYRRIGSFLTSLTKAKHWIKR